MQHLDEGTLQAWLDRDRSGLDGSGLDTVRRHLDACADCRARLRTLEAESVEVARLLSGSAASGPPAPPWEAVAGRAQRRRSAGRRRRRWTAAAWAASVALALGAGWVARDLARPPAFVPGPARQEVAPEGAAPAPAPLPGPPADRAPAPVGADAPGRDDAPAAPAEALVRGRVTDRAGVPIASAQVFLDGTDRGALTDAEGDFELRLSGIPGDSAVALDLVARHIGYAPGSRPLVLRGGDTLAAGLRLEAQAVALDEIVVTGSPAAGERAREADAGEGAGPRAAVAASGPVGSWEPTSLGRAGAVLGSPLPVVGRYGVVRVEARAGDGPPVVRILQQIRPGVVLELLVARDGTPLPDRAGPDERARLVVRREGFVVEARAPVLPEELEALLRGLR